MQKELFMAVDLGTSFIKTGVYAPDGTFLAGASERVEDERPSPGVFIQRGEALFGSVLRCIRRTAEQLGEDASRICAVAFTGQMAGSIGVDENWQDVTTWSCSLDNRYIPYAERQRRQYADSMFAISATNAPVMCAKYAWFRDEFPEEHRRIAKYVMLNGYMIGRLSGIPVEEAAIDRSLITWTGMADVRSYTWSKELCSAFGVDPAHLPRIAACTEVGGFLSERYAKQLSLRSGIPLILGAGDKVSGTVGADVFEPGEMLFEAASYGAVSCRIDSMRLDQERRNYDVIGAADPGGYYAHKYIQGSGIAIDWFMQEFVARGGDMDAAYRDVEQKAAAVPPGSDRMLAVGLLNGSAIPFDSSLRGLFMGHTLNHGLGHFYRSLLEGFSYDLALTLRSLHKNYPGCADSTVKLIGGGARSSVWPGILAGVTGHRFAFLSRSDVALWGAALIAARGVGAVDDLHTAAGAAVRITGYAEPDPEAQRAYQPYIEMYDRIVRSFGGVFSELAAL